MFADAGERSQEIVRKSQKAAEELAEIAKANVEALTEAGRIAASGARTIGQDAIASGRQGIEQASAAVKTLAEAKSPTEFFQLQSELARASFDRAVAEGSKLTEQLVKLAGEAVPAAVEPRQPERRAHQRARCLISLLSFRQTMRPSRHWGGRIFMCVRRSVEPWQAFARLPYFRGA